MANLTANGNKIRVMLVDDSAVIRGLISRALSEYGGMEVVASAANGSQAVVLVKSADPQIILLDIEMPEMDGITALPLLLKAAPNCRIIMVSTLTERNADISLRALQLGATDYVTKPSSRLDQQVTTAFYKELTDKIIALAPKRIASATPVPTAVAAKPIITTLPVKVVTQYPMHPVQALAIGSSTGGPQALNAVFTALAGKLPHIPIFITQHMPATFTAILADHIGKASGKPCTEGKDGEVVVPGKIYVAPGNFHMVPQMSGTSVVIKLNQGPQENFCRPAVDPMLRGLSAIYGKNLLTVILTGMGSDGMLGCKEVIKNSGTVAAQDEPTCVVYGMPKAVVENNLCKAVLPLAEIAPYILKACGGA